MARDHTSDSQLLTMEKGVSERRPNAIRTAGAACASRTASALLAACISSDQPYQRRLATSMPLRLCRPTHAGIAVMATIN